MLREVTLDELDSEAGVGWWSAPAMYRWANVEDLRDQVVDMWLWKMREGAITTKPAVAFKYSDLNKETRRSEFRDRYNGIRYLVPTRELTLERLRRQLMRE